MNFIANETPQKLRGGFYTDPDIAAFLARWVLEIKPESILEPSCGSGVFLEALCNGTNHSLKRIFACELHPEEAEKCRSKVSEVQGVAIEVFTGDFLRWFIFHGEKASRFEGVVGNPPFIRYQYLDEAQQFLAEKIVRQVGQPFTKHANAWVPFVIASLALLAPGGRLAMVVPAELFHIPHAQCLRNCLVEWCSQILVLDPEELWFDEAQQGVVLLLAEKKKVASQNKGKVAVQSIRHRHSLHSGIGKGFELADYVVGPAVEGKWMTLFLSGKLRALLEGLRLDARIPAFGEIADVDVGIVTGANKFFLVPDEVVEQFGLRPWAHAMFGRSEHVAGLIYDLAQHETNRQAGLPTNFLWFDDKDADAFPPEVQQYLNSGIEEGLPTRYKCRVRVPWFRVPSVYTAPVAMLKRAHHFPRLVLNAANAFTTDTAYRIRPRRGTAVSLVYSFTNSLTCLSAELEGRHYGGGVLELVPSEIERLRVPLTTCEEAGLRELDHRFRQARDGSELLRAQDRVLLGRQGLTENDQDALHQAWDELRRRRQRNREAE